MNNFADFSSSWEAKSKAKPLRKALQAEPINSPSELIIALEDMLENSTYSVITYFFSDLKRCEIKVQEYDRRGPSLGSLSDPELERLKKFLSDAEISTTEKHSDIGHSHDSTNNLVIDHLSKEDVLQKLKVKYITQAPRYAGSDAAV